MCGPAVAEKVWKGAGEGEGIDVDQYEGSYNVYRISYGYTVILPDLLVDRIRIVGRFVLKEKVEDLS